MNAQKMSQLKGSPDRIDQSSLERNRFRHLIRWQNELFSDLHRHGLSAAGYVTETVKDTANYPLAAFGRPTGQRPAIKNYVLIRRWNLKEAVCVGLDLLHLRDASSLWEVASSRH